MSSSEQRFERLRLVDFSRQKVAPRPAAFVQCSSFEHLRQPGAPPPTPEESYQRGLNEGEKRGRSAAQKELEPALQALLETAQSLAQARAQRIAAAEQDLVEIAAEIARRILHGELRQGNDSVLRMARACLDAARGGDGPLVLRAAAPEVELLRAHLPELELDLAERQLQLVADPRISPGGIVLETPEGCFEGRPERILEAARGALHREEAP